MKPRFENCYVNQLKTKLTAKLREKRNDGLVKYWIKMIHDL